MAVGPLATSRSASRRRRPAGAPPRRGGGSTWIGDRCAGAARRTCRCSRFGSGSRRPAPLVSRPRRLGAAARRSPADAAIPRGCGRARPRDDGSTLDSRCRVMSRRIAARRRRTWTGCAGGSPTRCCASRRRCRRRVARRRRTRHALLHAAPLRAHGARLARAAAAPAARVLPDPRWRLPRSFTTAGGQTIGKMALGLKVVGEGSDGVPVGIAAARALGCLASTLCLGAGLVPALIHEAGARSTTVSPTPWSSGASADSRLPFAAPSAPGAARISCVTRPRLRLHVRLRRVFPHRARHRGVRCRPRRVRAAAVGCTRPGSRRAAHRRAIRCRRLERHARRALLWAPPTLAPASSTRSSGC